MEPKSLEKSTIGPSAYTWSTQEKCVMTKFLKQKQRCFVILQRQNRKENNFFLMSSMIPIKKG